MRGVIKIPKIGDRIKAKWTEPFPDHVTKGKVYEVVEIKELTHKVLFKIKNDNGDIIMPVSAAFELID